MSEINAIKTYITLFLLFILSLTTIRNNVVNHHWLNAKRGQFSQILWKLLSFDLTVIVKNFVPVLISRNISRARFSAKCVASPRNKKKKKNPGRIRIIKSYGLRTSYAWHRAHLKRGEKRGEEGWNRTIISHNNEFVRGSHINTRGSHLHRSLWQEGTKRWRRRDA